MIWNDLPHSKMAFTDRYFELQTQAQAKYGSQSIVLIQKGSFFEIYSYEDQGQIIGQAKAMAELLDIQLTATNKNKPITKSNPQMVGFPVSYREKYVNILVEHHYVVCVYVEQKEANGKINRVLDTVETIGTSDITKFSSDQNFIGGLYYELDNQLICVCCVDLRTGNSFLYDIGQGQIEEIYRFLSSYRPCEILIHLVSKQQESLTECGQDLINQLDLKNSLVHLKLNAIKSIIYKPEYQNKFYSRFFPAKERGLLSTIEYLNLERHPLLSVCFISLLEYIYECNEQIVGLLKPPNIWSPLNQLIIDYNSLYQLEIINYPGIKRTTVLSVVDQTKTAMGRRLLRNWLVCPINDTSELNRRYNNIAWATSSTPVDSQRIYQTIQSILVNIIDIEKLQQKITTNKLQPSQLLQLDTSYHHILSLINQIKQLPTGLQLACQVISDELQAYISDYQQTFVIERMNVTLETLDESIFIPGKYPAIDELDNLIKNYYADLEKTQIYLNSLLQQKFGNKPDLIRLKKTDKSEEYYFTLTNPRYTYLISQLNNSNIFKVTSMSNGKKLTTNSLDRISRNLVTSKLKLRQLISQYYTEYLNYLAQKYLKLMIHLVQYVAELDVICSNAKVAILYKYCRPEIDMTKSKAYIEAQDLRHPVVERISSEFFVPNDISLGQDINGMLLYGINGIGKTVIILTTAINLILGQAGLYVAGKQFRYNPFDRVMTRLTANHGDIAQGKGSFEIEMIELRKIIQRADNKTLVIADEICRGTEHNSGLGIVAATVKYLAQRKVNFMLATHIHELINLELIKQLKNVKTFHLTIEMVKGQIIYKRKLQVGDSIPLYGIEICRSLGMPKEFVAEALKVRREYNQETDTLVAYKTSHYNTKAIMDKCQICDSLKELHTHHIIYQSESDEYHFLENGIHKNSSNNLVTLCRQCHTLVHQNKIKITGYKQTDQGIKLIHK